MRVLVSPLGLSPGSLFSAIVLTKPEHVVVLTSALGQRGLEASVAAARSRGPAFTVEAHSLADPFAGFAEGRQLARRLAARWRERDDLEVVANLAGGTTALQDAVKCLADLLGAREIAVVDRRSLEEQRQDPFVVGELVDVPPIVERNQLGEVR